MRLAVLGAAGTGSCGGGESAGSVGRSLAGCGGVRSMLGDPLERVCGVAMGMHTIIRGDRGEGFVVGSDILWV